MSRSPVAPSDPAATTPPAAALHPETRAAHVTAPSPVHGEPLSVPIFQTTTYAFDDPDVIAEAMTRPDTGYTYTRYSNPTVRALEMAVADLEGGVAALATSSGMGAINAVLIGLVRTGDHVVAQRCLYGGSYATLTHLQEDFGVEVTFVGGADVAEVREALRPNTRVLYLETIANPMTQVADIPVLAAAARLAGTVTVVDNTFASPVLCRPIEHGADIVIHSTTKYLGGHSDVTGGIAVFADEALYRSQWKRFIELGVTADPFAAWLTLRGLATLTLRMRQQCENAHYLTSRLADHPAVSAVHWPGMADHPSVELAERLLSDAGGVFSFDLAGGRDAGRDFVRRVRLAKLAASLGGTETLVLHPASTSHRQLSAAALTDAGIGEGTIRVAVGIEHPGDIWADFSQALEGL
jgi:cystathionine beta-lyase/cystathionine gamma-synthase